MTEPSRRKRFYYGPWKVKRHEPVHRIVIFPGANGGPRFVVEGFKELERKVGPGVPWTETRREERDQVDLHYLVQKLKLEGADDALLELMRGGVETLFRLAHLYQWHLQKEEEKRRRPEEIEKERRRTEQRRKEEHKYQARRKAEEKQRQLKLRKEKREAAARAKALKLEAKKKEAQAKAEKRAQEIAEKKALAEKRRKEREAAAEAKRLAQAYWRPVQRTMDV